MKIFESLHAGWRALTHQWTEHILVRKWFDIGLRAKMSALVTIGLTGLIAIFGFIAVTNPDRQRSNFSASMFCARASLQKVWIRASAMWPGCSQSFRHRST